MTDREREVSAVIGEVKVEDPSRPPSGISAEEYRNIRADVQRSFRERFSIPDGDDGTTRGLQRSFLEDPDHRLLLVVYGVSIVIIVVGVLLSVRPIDVEIEEARTGRSALETTESAVIGVLQGRASEKLSTRERRIAEIERQLDAARERAEGAERIAELEAELDEIGATAAERLAILASSPEQTDRILDEIEAVERETNAAIAEAERRVEAMRASLRELRDRVAESENEIARLLSNSRPEVPGSDAMDIVAVRALLRAIVASGEVREDHPELADQIEPFFEQIEEQNRLHGYELGLRDASRAIRAYLVRVTGTSGAPDGADREHTLDRLIAELSTLQDRLLEVLW